MRKRVIFHPPSRQSIEQHVKKVSERLAARGSSYITPEVMTGLIRFLQLAAGIVAKNLNKEHEAEDKFLANKDK